MSDKDLNTVESYLLSDSPSDEDALGGHTKIAKALHHIIRNDTGGKSIALTGNYGSGKSSVIGFLNKLFENQDDIDNYRIFTFDAWKHQQDPIRRSFIEELIDFLDGKWLIKEDWKNEIDQLTHRSSKTVVETYPKATYRAYISAIIVLILIPLGFILFNSGIDKGDETLLTVGGLLIASPILYPLLYSLFSLSWQAFKEAYNIFIYEDYRKEITETIKTPDPTTIEFRNIFQELMGSVLRENERNLIIVVDNLDRLESSKAIEIWSSLLTYLSQIDSVEEDWIDRVWLIAPFDLMSLNNLWDEKSNSKSAGKEFLKKTFQVRLNVPPVILSDWKKFFREHFKKAFPNLQNTEDILFNVITLYEDSKSSNPRPTPRDIKIYLNNLSALYRQRGDEIGLTELAFFLIKEEDFKTKGGIEEIVEEDSYLNPIEADVLVDNWKESISAIHFNVPLENATEVLIGNDVKTALLEGNGNTLIDLKETPGYSDIIKKTANEILNDPTPIMIGNLAIALKANKYIDNHIYNRIWNRIQSSFLKLNTIGKAQEQFSLGCIALLEKTDKLKSTANKTISLFSSIELNSDNINDWVNAITPIITHLVNAGLDEALKEINPAVKPEMEIELFTAVSRNEELKSHVKYFLSQENFPNLIKSIQQRLSQRNLEELDIELFKLLVYIDANSENKLKVEWDSLVQGIKKQFLANTNLNANQVYLYLSVILFLHSKNIGAIDNYINSIKQAPIVPHYLNKYWEEFPTSSVCILFLLLYNPTGNLQRQEGSSNNGIGQFNSLKTKNSLDQKRKRPLLNEIKRLELASLLVEKAPQERFSLPLFKNLSEIIVDQFDDLSSINLNTVLNNALVVFNSLSKEYSQKLISKLSNQQADFIDRVINKIPFEQEYFSLFELIIKTPRLKDENTFIEYLKSNFQSIKKEDWIYHFENSNSLLESIIHLVQDKNELELKESYLDALIEFSKYIKSGDKKAIVNEGVWFHLVYALSPKKHNTFYTELLHLLTDDIKSSINILPLYTEIITQEDFFIKHAQKISNDYILELLKIGDLEGLNWLIDESQWVESILNALKSSELESFNLEAKNIFDQHDVQEREKISRLSKKVDSLDIP